MITFYEQEVESHRKKETEKHKSTKPIEFLKYLECITLPIIRPQNAPASFIRGQDIAKQNIIAIGGER